MAEERGARLKPVVCWDFDETLGYFRPHEFAWAGRPRPASLPPPRLKPGIAALLESLSGFTHVVTTAALREYARDVLREHDLLRHFAAVFGREDGMWPKDYGVVARQFGVSEQQMIIVGNDAADVDCRGRPIVLVYDERMMDRPAAPLHALLEDLARLGFEACRRHEGFTFEYWGSYPVVRTILPMC